MLQPKDDIEAIEQSLSESAAFLLPLRGVELALQA